MSWEAEWVTQWWGVAVGWGEGVKFCIISAIRGENLGLQGEVSAGDPLHSSILGVLVP